MQLEIDLQNKLRCSEGKKEKNIRQGTGKNNTKVRKCEDIRVWKTY